MRLIVPWKQCLFFVCLLVLPLHAQERKRQLQLPSIQYPIGKSDFVVHYRTNDLRIDSVMDRLDNMLRRRIVRIDSICVSGYASPDGPYGLNINLAKDRAKTVVGQIVARYPDFASHIRYHGGGIAWHQLRSILVASDYPFKEDMIRLIDEFPEQVYKTDAKGNRHLVDSRKKQMMELHGGEAYKVLYNEVFPDLRCATSVAVSYHVLDPVGMSGYPTLYPERMANLQSSLESIEVRPDYKKPMFALKTNLLGWAGLAPNIEVEVPIGRWSINAEYLCGWWMKKRTFCWQVRTYALEARYWFKHDELHPLRGWFLGAFGLHGYYDFQLKKNQGQQGDLRYMVGLSGGYSKSLRKNLNIEFSLGAGYGELDYHDYTAVDDKYLIERKSKKRLKSILPGRAKISLVWLINRTVKQP